MANALIHSQSSVKRWGGKVEDYLAIHELIDSPKASMNNNSSRLITHNVWFCYHIIPKIFGYIENPIATQFATDLVAKLQEEQEQLTK
jgi:hypothetical protein